MGHPVCGTLRVSPGKHVYELLSEPYCVFEHCAGDGGGEGAGAGVGEDCSSTGEDHQQRRVGRQEPGDTAADADISRLQNG